MNTQKLLGNLSKIWIVTILPFFLGVAHAKAEILPPLVPIHETGDYLKTLEGMKDGLKNNDLRKFYTLARDFREKMAGNRRLREIRKRPKITREDQAALEWWSYYVAKAPLIPYEGLRRSSYEEFLQLDIAFKAYAFKVICQWNVEERGKFLKLDPRRLDACYLSQFQAVMKDLNDGFKAWEKHAEEAGKLQDLMRERPKITDPDEDIEETLREWKKRYFEVHAFAGDFRRRRDFFRNEIKDELEPKFIRKLIKSFPKDGGKVQEIIMKSGYETKEKCRDLLLREIQPNKETRHFFQGLPVIEKIKKP